MAPNKRLKLTARVDYGMNCSSARRSLSAIRYAAVLLYMMRLYFLLGFALMASACSRAGPARIPGSGREDLLLQAYNYGVDLAKREGANLRPCVGFERGRESTD